MVWVGRDLNDHLVPTLCREQGHLPLDQVAQIAELIASSSQHGAWHHPEHLWDTLPAPSPPAPLGNTTSTDPEASLLSQNHRITESQNVGGWKGPLEIPHPTICQSRVTQSRLHSTAARRVWNISREGDSTAPLGSLGQGSGTLRGKKFFLGFSWNFPGFSWCPLPLVLSLGTTAKSLAPSS